MKAFVVAFALVTAAGAAAAESNQTQESREASPERSGTESQDDEKSDRVICRRIRGGMATGSQLTQRRCLTAEQWRRLRDR
jgi:hypothetical protein